MSSEADIDEFFFGSPEWVGADRSPSSLRMIAFNQTFISTWRMIFHGRSETFVANQI